jgi:hypothetical protein
VSSLLPLCKHQEQFLLLIGHGQYFSMLWLSIRLADHYQIGVEFIAAVQASGTISVAHRSWSVFLDAMVIY